MNQDIEQLRAWAGHDLVDQQGQKIGQIDELYIDDDTGRPEFLSVRTGLFGTRSSFVPLRGTTSRGDVLESPWDKDTVKGAPNVEAEGHLSPDQESELYRYYGITDSASYDTARERFGERSTMTAGDVDTDIDTDADATAGGRLGEDLGGDTSGPSTDKAMTRSEEELRVGTTQQRAGTARLRKWVETQHASTEVPVAREEVRVEREPITDANIGAAMDGPEISEEEHEMPLYEEQAVVNTEVVPKERVRLDKEVVTDQQTVDADLRKEHIDVDGADVDLDAEAEAEQHAHH